MFLNDFCTDRTFIIGSLQNYKSNILEKRFFQLSDHYREKETTIDEIISFVKDNENCFYRNCLKGHITSSALVVNQNFTKILLTYHAKLNKWLQLGGHCDGESIVYQSALREAKEESGLKSIDFIDIENFPNILSDAKIPQPFDIDIHYIPERKNEPGHFHYDIRYLLFSKDENITISEESLDLKWIQINEINFYSNEVSCLRQVEKLKYLIAKLKR
ncbi:NUDIX hydrolase [Pigmentibacter sp. JX0631]|uniref:NUDIX hydrolase n=1 Tax=Pigmentibacter sp. JX0631 TaxID=2976982 RepID=UPI002469C2AD|nr:NUDIX hydrolase [Pigmentibacter sp. JX0631]WGL58507.1 NUDIX hydrolase [Pigmentibacter sp. JX0631]